MQQANHKKRPTVFLAHSSGDKTYVREIYRLLELDGFHPWLDEKNLIAGQNWELEVAKAVEAADAIALFLSSRALDNAGYLHKEIRLALDMAERLPEEAIKIIPIRLDRHEVPRRLRHLHWIDSDDTRFEPRLTKATRASVFDKLPTLQQFSIGNRYLQLQRALVVLEHGLDPWNQYQIDSQGDGREEQAEFLVRGQHKDGNQYYGRGRMKIGIEGDFSSRQVTLDSSIEGTDYSYSGSFFFHSEIQLDGKHKVHYWIGDTGDLAVGTWDNGGLEELISAHTNQNVPFSRW